MLAQLAGSIQPAHTGVDAVNENIEAVTTGFKNSLATYAWQLQLAAESEAWLALFRYGAGEPTLDDHLAQHWCAELLRLLTFVPSTTRHANVPPIWFFTQVGQLWSAAWLRCHAAELLTVSEAAKLAGVSVSTVSHQIARGQLFAVPDRTERNPQRRLRLRRTDVEALYANHP